MITLQIPVVLHRLDEATVAGQALRMPDLAAVGSGADAVCQLLAPALAERLGKATAAEWFRLGSPLDAELHTLELGLRAPAQDPCWREAIPLPVTVVTWAHRDGVRFVVVPALDQRMTVRDGSEWPAAVAALLATRLAAGDTADRLRRIAGLALEHPVELRHLPVTLALPAPGPRAVAGERPTGVLDQLTRPITGPAAYALAPWLERLATALRAGRSALLLGPSGVGKTALVRELVRTGDQHGLGAVSIRGTTGARIMAHASGFGGWEDAATRLFDEAVRTRTVLYLGSLFELRQVGPSSGGSESVASVLRPLLQRGALQVIAECQPHEATRIEREDPGLWRAFERIEVLPPDRSTLLQILASVAQRETAAPAPPPVLERIVALHERYARYSAAPGRQLRFLETLLRTGAPLTEAAVLAAFARETGLPRLLVDDAEPLDLDATRRFFAARVLGQDQAIARVVDVLAQVKAGIARPDRPLASLLFIGPTGVGKTELARCLAEFLFGDRTRMVRFDMSEYGDPWSVTRLIGGPGQDEGRMVAAVRDQPFGVLLLDEFEKADPSFFDLLLQVLGDGRLVDAQGREASFHQAVVILTSNLGAEALRQGAIGFGEDGGDARALAEAFATHVRRALRPELWNRLDALVPFAPLTAAVAPQVVRRELDQLCARARRQRGGQLEIELDDQTLQALAERGLDPRSGARGLRRVLEDQIGAEVARARSQGGTIHARARVTGGATLRITTQALTAAAPTEEPQALLDRLRADRKEFELALRSPCAQDLAVLGAQAERLAGKRKLSPVERQLVQRREQLAALRQALATHHAAVQAHEDDLAVAVLLDRPLDLAACTGLVDTLTEATTGLLVQLAEHDQDQPDRFRIAVFCEDAEVLRELVGGYLHAGFRCLRARHFIPATEPRSGRRAVVGFWARAPFEPPATQPEALRFGSAAARSADLTQEELARAPLFGVALDLSGPRAGILLPGEVGVHEVAGTSRERAAVQALGGELDEFVPPQVAALRDLLKRTPPVCIYEPKDGRCRDADGRAVELHSTRLREMVQRHLATQLRARALARLAP